MEKRNGNGNGREDIKLLYPTLKQHPPISTSTNNLTLSDQKLNTKLSYVIAGVNNGFNIMPTKARSKRPDWLGANASTYKASVDKLKLVYLQHPEYGYGLLAGKQLEDFHFICIDIDIDTEECKERISKELEELLSKHEIKYQKEITKSGRIHYYILLDKITDKIESISKLPYSGTCSKFKDGKETKGEIELFTKNKAVVVYDGIINDNKPFFTDKPSINDYKNFEAFLDEYLNKYETVESKEIKEPKKEGKSSIQRSELKEVFKTFRKYRIFNGWEGIDKLYSAYCIMENIPENQIMEDLKDIWGEEYDERLTKYLIQNTQKKYKAGSILPGLGSIYNYIREALKNDRLEKHERELLEKVLKDIANKGYSDYELPEYLQNAEDVILDSSTELTNKDGGKYYKESYFIVKNVKGIKKVIYVNIITSERGGIYKPHSFDGKIKEVGIKAEIVRLVQDGSKTPFFEYLLNDETLYKPSFNYSKLDDIVNEITSKAVHYTMLFDTALYKRYLSRLIENYRGEHGKLIPCVISRQTGWSDDLKFFYHYGLNDEYHELHPDHLLYQYRKNVIKDKDEQHEVVKKILQEGKLLGLLIVASVGSLLIKPFNIPSITIIISGKSGAGKTTSALIATSLFYYSDDVLINTSSTQVGLELTISKLNSLPVLIDEGALVENDNSLEKLVFKASSGRGRTRGRKDLTVDLKELKSNIFWTTETTEIDKLKRDGAFRRMLYLVVNSWNDFTSLFRPEDGINKRYAGCGIDYIKYAIEKMEDIRKAFDEETKDFSYKYKEITNLALNLYSGLILLEKYYETKFENLRKTIDKVLDDAKALFIENKENIVEKLKELLNRKQHIHFHILHPDGRIERAKQEAWGEYKVVEEIYYITKDGWNMINRELGKNSKLTTGELKKAGILTYKDYRHKATGERIKTYIVKFNDDENIKDDENANDDEEVEF